jgi:putative DNA primase/helicase
MSAYVNGARTTSAAPSGLAGREAGNAIEVPSADAGSFCRDDGEISRLAKLPVVQYERERKEAAERLGTRIPILDRLVAAERTSSQAPNVQGRALALPEPAPWPEPVHGAALLDDLASAIRRHVVLPTHAADASALWIIHTYLVDMLDISPRLAITSPERGCGKTTLLDVLSHLVERPLAAANATASAIFRVIELAHPTLLIDECDTFLMQNEELRGILNSGHRRGGAVLRTVGDDHEPRQFGTYGACAIAPCCFR